MNIHNLTEVETHTLETEFYLATEQMVQLPDTSKRRGELSRDISHMVFELNARQTEQEQDAWIFS